MLRSFICQQLSQLFLAGLVSNSQESLSKFFPEKQARWNCGLPLEHRVKLVGHFWIDFLEFVVFGHGRCPIICSNVGER